MTSVYIDLTVKQFILALAGYFHLHIILQTLSNNWEFSLCIFAIKFVNL